MSCKSVKKLIILPLDEAAEYRTLATPQECAAAAEFGSSRRRAEFLSWRGIVRHELGAGVGIFYDAAGAPHVDREGTYIGISHCDGYVAVAVSDEPCAVDIEPAGRDFMRIARRFAAPEELETFDSPLRLGILWCAKEVMYKLSGRTGLDFRRDIFLEREITAPDGLSGKLRGRICGGQPMELAFEIREGYILVYRL